MELRDYPFEVVQFSCGKCLRNGRYKKSALIEKYTADIPLPDLRSHIAGDCERMTTQVNDVDVENVTFGYPQILKYQSFEYYFYTHKIRVGSKIFINHKVGIIKCTQKPN